MNLSQTGHLSIQLSQHHEKKVCGRPMKSMNLCKIAEDTWDVGREKKNFQE